MEFIDEFVGRYAVSCLATRLIRFQHRLSDGIIPPPLGYFGFVIEHHFFVVPLNWSFNSSIKCFRNFWKSVPPGLSIFVPPISEGSWSFSPVRISWTFLWMRFTPRWNVGEERRRATSQTWDVLVEDEEGGKEKYLEHLESRPW